MEELKGTIAISLAPFILTILSLIKKCICQRSSKMAIESMNQRTKVINKAEFHLAMAATVEVMEDEGFSI